MLVDVLQRFRPMQARPAWWHYGAAVVLVVVAYAVRVELEGVYHHPFLTFIAALLLSALFLDHGAGVLATLLGAALAPRFFTEPGSGYGLGGADAAVATAAFLGFGLFVAGIFEVLWRTVDRLSDANRQLAEANRRLSLAEHQARSADELKATLLADIHHRLKNSLHGAAGMLRTEAGRTNDSRSQSVIESVASRLQVLARLHERLHIGGEPDSTVCMREFLQALCSDLATTIVGDQPISISVSADQVHLAVEQAVPVGLIVNEAVTNALKYAFPQGGAGRIAVELRRRGDDKLCLEIMDNGWGRESGSQDETASSGGTGTRLIQALARQLDGDAEWQGPPGTRVVVTVTQRL